MKMLSKSSNKELCITEVIDPETLRVKWSIPYNTHSCYADVVKQATLGENKKGLSHVPGMGDGSENQHVVQKSELLTVLETKMIRACVRLSTR